MGGTVMYGYGVGVFAEVFADVESQSGVFARDIIIERRRKWRFVDENLYLAIRLDA